MIKNNDKIRKLLEEVENIIGVTSEKRIDILEENGVKALPPPYPWDDLTMSLANVNCFAYALNLGTSKIFHEIAYEDGSRCTNKFFAGIKFVTFLMENKYLHLLRNPQNGCVIIYFDEENIPRHAALLRDNSSAIMVESTWGTYRKIFKHELWKVPLNYGSQIKYYFPLSKEEAEEYFLKYCEWMKSK